MLLSSRRYIPKIRVRYRVVERRRRRRVLMVLRVQVRGVRRVVRREMVAVLAVLALAAERAQRHRHVGHFVTATSSRRSHELTRITKTSCTFVHSRYFFIDTIFFSSNLSHTASTLIVLQLLFLIA